MPTSNNTDLNVVGSTGAKAETGGAHMEDELDVGPIEVFDRPAAYPKVSAGCAGGD
ncbi:MAG: hypothetical protein RIB84_05630 [Sneathiellaceae bacterium]